MKAHGITGNNSGARAGSAGPSEPSNPTPRKTLPGSRPSNNKKRKLAAIGSDLDDQVKTEVKAEVKQEPIVSNNTEGSYIIHPSEPLEAKARTLGVPGESYKTETIYDSDEMLLVLGPHTKYGGSAAPMTFVQQMLLPPSRDSFYGFIDSFCDTQAPSPTSHPLTHDRDADCSTQTMIPSDPAVSHWLQHHQNASFF